MCCSEITESHAKLLGENVTSGSPCCIPGTGAAHDDSPNWTVVRFINKWRMECYRLGHIVQTRQILHVLLTSSPEMPITWLPIDVAADVVSYVYLVLSHVFAYHFIFFFSQQIMDILFVPGMGPRHLHVVHPNPALK